MICERRTKEREFDGHFGGQVQDGIFDGHLNIYPIQMECHFIDIDTI